MHALAIAVVAAALLGILVRPFRVNEAWWALGGAALLVAVGLLSLADAGRAVARGLDVYLFLAGMMALGEFARDEGVFAWVAASAVRRAAGSRGRLLLLVYAAGVLTTAFLSNDATIVVLTPAVIEALRRTDAEPAAYVVACALVANAASFVLPIANPANLLFFAARMPPLGAWFGSFGWPALASISLTFAALLLVFRRAVAAPLAVHDADAAAPRATTLAMLAFAAVALVVTSSVSGPLGAVTFGLGCAATLVGATRDRAQPLRIVRGIAWPVLPLTAGLFVLVEALERSGAAALGTALFTRAATLPAPLAQCGVALGAALASNLANNLPVSLALGGVVAHLHPADGLASAALIGVNVGPNFTTNGSLATILWLAILRREKVAMSPWRFAAIGLAATPAALAGAALLAR